MVSITTGQMSNSDDAPRHNPTITLADFAGTWRLSRHIQQGNGEVFTFDGEAIFTWREAQLVYKECGQVTAPNGRLMEAERTYIWRQGVDNQIDVYFDDNRFFHHFSLHTPSATHLCGDDQYKVDYTFTQWPEWASSWRVIGPRKDYKMLSRYRPG